MASKFVRASMGRAINQDRPRPGKKNYEFPIGFEIAGYISSHCRNPKRHTGCTSLKCSCECHKEVA